MTIALFQICQTTPIPITSLMTTTTLPPVPQPRGRISLRIVNMLHTAQVLRLSMKSPAQVLGQVLGPAKSTRRGIRLTRHVTVLTVTRQFDIDTCITFLTQPSKTMCAGAPSKPTEVAPPAKRESRKREYLERRETNPDAVRDLLNSTCPCGKHCFHRLCTEATSAFTGTLEVRTERFSLSQREESAWWFKILKACVVRVASRKGFMFRFLTVEVCRFAFYEVHGFRGPPRQSSRAKRFEALLLDPCNDLQVPPPAGSNMNQTRSVKNGVALQWIWRYVKVFGSPKPNSSGPSGKMYVWKRKITDLHEMYTESITGEGR